MELHTDRLRLREFRADDWTAVLAYQSDPRYLRYYEWTERTPEAVQAFVQRFVKQQHEQPRTKYQLAVCLAGSDMLVGNCGIRLASPGSHEADIGYELAPNYWGRGYATEAAQAVVGFGFTQLKVHRIWAECVADNTASERVLTKIGMQREGRLRDKAYYKGRYRDVLLFAILEHEWATGPDSQPLSSV